MSGLILPNRRQFSYETLLREVNQSITFLRCWSSDHELLFLKRVACTFLNSRSSGSDTRGNCNGRPSLYDFIKSPKERERSLLSLSKSGSLITLDNTTNYSLNQSVLYFPLEAPAEDTPVTSLLCSDVHQSCLCVF